MARVLRRPWGPLKPRQLTAHEGHPRRPSSGPPLRRQYDHAIKTQPDGFVLGLLERTEVHESAVHGREGVSSHQVELERLIRP